MNRLLPLLLLLAVPGCWTVPPKPDFGGLAVRDARQEIRRQNNALADFSAAVNLSIDSKDFQGSLSGALILKAPTHLRLRTSKLFRDVFDLVVTPDQIALYVYADNVLLVKADTPEPVASPAPPKSEAELFWRQLNSWALRLSLSRFELPAPTDEDPLELSDRVVREKFERRGELFYVINELRTGEVLERIFDGRTLFPKEVLAREDGELTLRVTYDEYKFYDGFWVATKVSLQDLKRDSGFTVRLEDLAVNEGFQPGAFVLDVPPETQVRH